MRLVFETGKPIAQVARELGVNDGWHLGNSCARARREHDGENPPLSESERVELDRLWRENIELRMQRVLKRSVAIVGERGDGPVAMASFIAAQRADHQVPYVPGASS